MPDSGKRIRKQSRFIICYFMRSTAARAIAVNGAELKNVLK
jgi:hypothetical protein